MSDKTWKVIPIQMNRSNPSFRSWATFFARKLLLRMQSIHPEQQWRRSSVRPQHDRWPKKCSRSSARFSLHLVARAPTLVFFSLSLSPASAIGLDPSEAEANLLASKDDFSSRWKLSEVSRQSSQLWIKTRSFARSLARSLPPGLFVN